MGFVNSPTLHNFVIQSRLHQLPGTYPYIDDIGVGGDTREECQKRVDLVRQRLSPMELPEAKQQGPTDKEVTFAGARIGHLTSTPVPRISHLPPPTTKSEVKRINGALNWVRRMVPGFNVRTEHIQQHQRNHTPVWSLAAQQELT
eukprot:GHVN01017211.1.p1 GENE.GHVN01017211.1~~GHVN01017211.1.p1  ORF type:complete len:145 (-),score=3.57 GHVN01017211.1:932-1366(-)